MAAIESGLNDALEAMRINEDDHHRRARVRARVRVCMHARM